MNKKPKRYARVVYTPPRGLVRDCKFVAEHETYSGIWWELKDMGGATFRARPGACRVV